MIERWSSGVLEIPAEPRWCS